MNMRKKSKIIGQDEGELYDNKLLESKVQQSLEYDRTGKYINQGDDMGEQEDMNEENMEDDDRLTYTLITLDLGDLIHIFEENNISFIDMLLLSKEDLKELQLKLYQRNRIYNFSILFSKYAKNYSISEISDFFSFNQKFIFNSSIYDTVMASQNQIESVNEDNNEENNNSVEEENNQEINFNDVNNRNDNIQNMSYTDFMTSIDNSKFRKEFIKKNNNSNREKKIKVDNNFVEEIKNDNFMQTDWNNIEPNFKTETDMNTRTKNLNVKKGQPAKKKTSTTLYSAKPKDKNNLSTNTNRTKSMNKNLKNNSNMNNSNIILEESINNLNKMAERKKTSNRLNAVISKYLEIKQDADEFLEKLNKKKSDSKSKFVKYNTLIRKKHINKSINESKMNKNKNISHVASISQANLNINNIMNGKLEKIEKKKKDINNNNSKIKSISINNLNQKFKQEYDNNDNGNNGTDFEVDINLEYQKMINKIEELEQIKMDYNSFNHLSQIKQYIQNKGDNITLEDISKINNELIRMIEILGEKEKLKQKLENCNLEIEQDRQMLNELNKNDKEQENDEYENYDNFNLDEVQEEYDNEIGSKI